MYVRCRVHRKEMALPIDLSLCLFYVQIALPYTVLSYRL